MVGYYKSRIRTKRSIEVIEEMHNSQKRMGKFYKEAERKINRYFKVGTVAMVMIGGGMFTRAWNLSEKVMENTGYADFERIESSLKGLKDIETKLSGGNFEGAKSMYLSPELNAASVVMKGARDGITDAKNTLEALVESAGKNERIILAKKQKEERDFCWWGGFAFLCSSLVFGFGAYSRVMDVCNKKTDDFLDSIWERRDDNPKKKERYEKGLYFGNQASGLSCDS
jgi:hypothetical protein